MGCDDDGASMIVMGQIIFKSRFHILIGQIECLQGFQALVCSSRKISGEMRLPVSWRKNSSIGIKNTSLIEDRTLISFFVQGCIVQRSIPSMFPCFAGITGWVYKKMSTVVSCRNPERSGSGTLSDGSILSGWAAQYCRSP